jgi:uncharacterized membrane protein YphA (DoxX/SURF4 family)
VLSQTELPTHHVQLLALELDRGSESEGFEYHLLVLAMVGFLMIRGPGALSVDRAFTVAAGD